jgi:hypothetical protein
VLNEAGVLAALGHADAFASAIRELLANRAQIAALRRRSLELSATRGWDTVFDRLEQDYLATIAAHQLATR